MKKKRKKKKRKVEKKLIGFELLHKLHGHKQKIYDIKWSRDGRMLASASGDKTVCIWDSESGELMARLIGHEDAVLGISWSPDGRTIASCSEDSTIQLWDVESQKKIITLDVDKKTDFGKGLYPLQKMQKCAYSIEWSPLGGLIAWGHGDQKICIWDARNSETRQVFGGRIQYEYQRFNRKIKSMKYDIEKPILSGDVLKAIDSPGLFQKNQYSKQLLPEVSWIDKDWIGGYYIPNVVNSWYQKMSRIKKTTFYNVVWSPDGLNLAFSIGSCILLLNALSGEIMVMLQGGTLGVELFNSVAWSPDGHVLVAGCDNGVISIWNIMGEWQPITLEGHTDSVISVSFSYDGRLLASKSIDGTVRIWDCDKWEQIEVMRKSGFDQKNGAEFNSTSYVLATLGGDSTSIRIWKLDYDVIIGAAPAKASVHYTNAKVVLVGESGVGKSGLGHRIVEDKWVVTDSSHGMKVWSLKLGEGKKSEEKEVWLWDLAGQPDYRLIHQLYFDETGLALMLFNPAHPEDPFREVGEWEKAMRTALGHEPAKLLVAARIDRGGATISKEKIEQFCKKRGYAGYFETSAKLGKGCNELRKALVNYIPWDKLPFISTTKIFKALKDALFGLKGAGMVLIQFEALKKQVQSELKEEIFEDVELRTVVRLLAGQGLIKQLAFGDFVLLQPEQINNYASAVIREAREHVDGIGTVNEDKVLEGRIDFMGMNRVSQKDEEILLRAMMQMLLEQSLCIREETAEGIQLVFPSQFKREMPEIPEHPQICVKYKFGGNLAAVYATLVVRLIYSKAFEKKGLWRNAAEFLTPEGKRIGFLMEYLGEGNGEITVFFDEGVPDDTRVTFIKYIHEHLLRRTVDVERQRKYICPECGKPVEDREAVKFRLYSGKKDVGCVHCDARISLYDLIEKKFNEDKFLRRVQELDARAGINLDNESKEIILSRNAK